MTRVKHLKSVCSTPTPHMRERSRRTSTLCARERADARTARVPENPTLRIPFATSMNTTVHLHGCPQSQPYICAHGCRVLERTVVAGAFRETDTGVTWRCLHAMQSANRDCNHAIMMAIMQRQRHVRQSRSTSTNVIHTTSQSTSWARGIAGASAAAPLPIRAPGQSPALCSALVSDFANDARSGEPSACNGIAL